MAAAKFFFPIEVAGPTGATAATRYAGGTASGAPGSGTFAKGDFVIDQAGKVWVCTTAGSPGTWADVGGGGGGGSVATDTIWDAAGDLAVGTGADTAAKLSLGASGNALVSNGSTAVWDRPPGYKWDSTTTTTDLTVTATTAATAQSFLTGNSVTYDGTEVLLEYWIALVTSSGGGVIVAELYDGSTDQSLRIGQAAPGSGGFPLYGSTLFTPSAAAHTYSIKLWRASANCLANGSGGGIFPAAWMRVSKT